MSLLRLSGEMKQCKKVEKTKLQHKKWGLFWGPPLCSFWRWGLADVALEMSLPIVKMVTGVVILMAIKLFSSVEGGEY